MVSNFSISCILLIIFEVNSLVNVQAEPLVEPPMVLAEAPISDAPKLKDYEGIDVEEEQWSIHGQSTYIIQQKNNFNSSYYGQNSLLNQSEGGGGKSYTLSATAFIGTRLWTGSEVYWNPEMFEGTPFNGQLVGLGGFQNGELQKGSYAPPVYYSARLFIRQTFGLGGGTESMAKGANQLEGNIDKNRIVLNYGKFATLDFFDQNSYSHDPRTQFQNFALFSMGAYSYAADTKGYTYGVVGELYQNDWIVKIARLALPTIPNTEQLDYSLISDYTNQIELTHKHRLMGQPGALRFLVYQQHAYMGSYLNAINLAQQMNTLPDITSVRIASQSAWGYGLNFEQAVSDRVGIFGRWSWNPGTTETQTVDISNSLAGGISIKGVSWSRESDTLGIGFAINGINSQEQTYLQMGGIAPFIGDGAISYKKEQIIEIFYSAKVYKDLFITADYQYISNPAYNSDRGPVHIFGLRAHVEM